MRYKPNVEKTACTETKKTHWLLIIGKKKIFFQYSNFTKVNSAKCVCLRKNCQLLLIKTHWSQFEYNDLLHPLNVYKIPAIQHEAVDFWVVDEISPSQILFWKYWEYVPLIFRNYKKLKRTKNVWLKSFSLLSAQ